MVHDKLVKTILEDQEDEIFSVEMRDTARLACHDGVTLEGGTM